MRDKEYAARILIDIEIATHAGEGRVTIQVRDRGPGMSEEVRTEVFEPLFSTRSFGIGLGLPLVKQIVEQHEGSIAIESVPGEGTTVSISLPLDAERA